MRNLPEYTTIMLPGNAGACDEEQRVQVPLFHKFLEGQHFQHPLSHDRGPAREARQSIYHDVEHHRLYSSQCGTTIPTASDSHPSSATLEMPSRRHPASDRPPPRHPLPDDIPSPTYVISS